MTGVVTADIKVDDKSMAAGYQVLSVDIVKEINRISYAQIVLLDDKEAGKSFSISEGGFFELGKSLTIWLYYGEKISPKDTVFKGLISQHRIQASAHRSLLSIELKDSAFKLTRQRKSRAFANQTDSDIIQQLVNSAEGLAVGNIEATLFKHPEMVQFSCSDWDFILSRAEANGHWVGVEDGSLSVVSPPLNASPKHTFRYGISDIYELELDADIRQQYGTVQGTAWDDTTQKIYPTPKQSKAVSLAQGNVSPEALASKIGTKLYDIATSSALDQAETQAWVDAQMIKSRLSLLRGRLKVPGFADIHLGDMMELDGVGDRFKGKTPVTGIRHQVSEQGWVTDIQFGLAADWFSQRRDLSELPANGLLPEVNGLQIGIVDQYLKDPEERFRVRVRLPMLPDGESLIWARLATLDAGANRGVCFRPEPGDEVILGFLNQDPRQAVILGALHSKEKPPPLPIDTENIQRGLVTPENLKLVLDDQTKSIRLETPGANRIILIDEDGAIYIADENNNQVTLNADGIQLVSDQDIAITAKGNIILKGANVDVK